ncbi:MFS transporter [Spirochaetia bacterium]|nr:MFS transporter [Spirochaetia bacterium]
MLLMSLPPPDEEILGRLTGTRERYAHRTILFCWLAYFVTYIGRYNYSACITAIITETGVTRGEAGLVSSFFFFSYMIGQMINAFFSRRINSSIYIGAALALSAGINFCMPFADPASSMKVLWCLNGVVQSVLWPHVVKILTEQLPEKRVAGGLVLMHTTGAAGSAGSYLISASCLRWFSWRTAFFVPAFILIGFVMVWFLVMPHISGVEGGASKTRAKTYKGGSQWLGIKTLVAGGVLFAILAAIGNGFLRDGITTWLPNYIHDVFKMESALAVFISVIIPIATVSGAFFAKKLYSMVRNPFLTTAILYGVTFMLIVSLILGLRHFLIPTCICFALCATMMTAVNTMLVSIIPLNFKAQGLTSMASGCINSTVYIGSIFSTSTFGILADHSGWNAVLYLISAAALIAALFCLIQPLQVIKKKVY